MPGIVVGVDGSEASRRALAWATQEATLRKAHLTVLTVHENPEGHWTGNPLYYRENEPAQEKAEAAAEDALTRGGYRGHASVRSIAGLAAEQLIEASRDAELLVVGSRGEGGFARLLMGSVSTQVVHHALCPVVVIPADWQPPATAPPPAAHP
jgi:nucleotide-binding universal stress UspA family protein